MPSLSSLRLVERAATLALGAWGFRSAWTDTPEGPVHVLVREGEPSAGPPIVLLHGLVASGSDYFPLLSRLAPTGRTLIAPDLPGHGLSPAPARGMRADVLLHAAEHALSAHLIEPAVVFGNSMGGFGAVRLAGRRPDLVSALVLASPGGAPLPEGEVDRFLARFRIHDAGSARAFVRDMRGRPSVLPELVAWGVMERFGRPEVRELLDQVDADTWLDPEELSSLEQPVLVVWGLEERILPEAHRAFYRRHLPPDAVFVEPPGLGHAPFLDDPEMLARLLGGFGVGGWSPSPTR